jgi:two-component system response regulator CpxR
MQTGKTSALHLCLVIESKQRIVADLKRDPLTFGLRGYQVDNFASAQEMLGLWKFDGIVLDACAFGPLALQILPRLRPRWCTPLVLLSDECTEHDQLAGLTSGATDVMPRLASTLLIAAKIRQLIEMQKQSASSAPTDVQVGRLRSTRMGAFLNGQPLRLTPRQFRILTLLMLREGTIVSRAEVNALLGGFACSGPRSLDVQICHLRKRLVDAGDGGLDIVTVRGRGYRLDRSEQARVGA